MADRRRTAALAGICLAAFAAAWTLFLLPHAAHTWLGLAADPERWWWAGPKFEGRFQDQLLGVGRPAPEDPRLRFVAIDAGSLAADFLPASSASSRGLQLLEAGWPWSREVYALLAERLLEAGARIVAFDLLFGPPRDGDDRFREVLAAHPGRIVLAADMPPVSYSQAIPDQPTIQGPSRTLLPDGWEEDPRVGFVNFWPELHGVIRAVRFRMTLPESRGLPPDLGEPRYTAFSARILALAGQQTPDDTAPHPFRYQSRNAYRPIPVYELLDPALWASNHGNGEGFKDAIVVVGPSAPELQDFKETPLGTLEGPRIHLHAIGAGLQRAFYREAPGWLHLLLTAVAALLGIVPAIRLRHHPILGLCALLGTAAAYFGTALGVYNSGDLLLPLSAPLVALLGSGIFGIGYEFSVEQREKARVRRIFESYVSRNVARAILDNRDEVLHALGGTRKPMALLFSDLRGFTGLSEHADPVELVAQLNEYLGAMVDIVFRHDGTLDKFIGDAVMGVWGNLASQGPRIDSEQAVRAALDMRDELARLNAGWRAQGRREFAFGIGIHHGEAVFGNIGSEQKKEPTAIGDAVNLASRLEGLTKICGVDIVLSDAVEEQVRGQFRLMPLGAIRVVGRSRAVGIYWPAGTHENLSPDAERIEAFTRALEAYRARRFEEALAQFLAYPPDAPASTLAARYTERCRTFAAEPPPADWDGSETMTGK